MRISFAQPLWLLALPLVVLIVWLAARHRHSALPGRPVRRWDPQRLAALTRAVTVLLLVVALAGPRLEAAGRGTDVAFLLDVSDSVGGGALADGREWIDAALATKPTDDRAAFALFGRDARLEYGLRTQPLTGPPAVLVDGSASDLARAVRLGQGVLGSESRRRAVLLSDGRQTDGDLVATARELAEAGIVLDVVPLPGAGVADVLIDEFTAPGRVREGEAYDVRTMLRNTGAADVDAVLVVTADGQEVDRRTVSLAPGVTETSLEQTAAESGTVRFEARLESGGSTIAQNDTGRTAVSVDGPPRVLIYEGMAGQGADLDAALASAAVPVDRMAADVARLPSLDELLAYDSVVLVDVSATALGTTAMRTLDAFVRDAGHGLVAVGGENSFGVGGYDGTPLEDLLPVFARVTDPIRRPSVAEALVIDTSGSMAACHCSGQAFGPQTVNGVNKTDIAKEAVARAVDQLEAQDQIGVLAFNTASEWVIPLQNLPSQAIVDDGLARLAPQGDTEIAQAVRLAIAGLRDAEARLRHIVLFSDGFMSDTSGLLDVAREAADAGITLSVVGTGEGAFDILRQMAEIGGGRYYPGRDLSAIPDIIALEVSYAARPIVTEGTFFPAVTGGSTATDELTQSPPLLGFLATTPKPAARTQLVIGDERDPLLASWQAGLGTATAWTSDVQARWSAQWLEWDRFARFWSDVVRETFPARGDPAFALSAAAGGEGLRIVVSTDADVPTGVQAEATVTGPDGQRQTVPLDRAALDRFEATVPAAAEGIYAVTVRLSSGGEVLYGQTTTATRTYAAEYAATEIDPGLLARAAEAGGGRFDPAPASAFDRDGVAPGASSRELWPLFALLGLLLLPVDVALRRLRLERADWGRARAWLAARAKRGGRRPVGPAVSRDAATDALFAAKARARGGAADSGAGDSGAASSGAAGSGAAGSGAGDSGAASGEGDGADAGAGEDAHERAAPDAPPGQPPGDAPGEDPGSDSGL